MDGDGVSNENDGDMDADGVVNEEDDDDNANSIPDEDEENEPGWLLNWIKDILNAILEFVSRLA